MSFTRHVGSVALALGTLSIPMVSFAATKTWDGGGVDNYWSTAANWSGDAVPGTGDTIVFDGTGKKNAIIGTTPFLYPIGELRMTTANTGTLTVGKAIVIARNLSISGGTLAIQGGAQVTNKGGWLNGGATFTAGTGEVVLAGSGTNYSLKESQSFKNLSLNDGLVRYWRFDGGPGATSVAEEVGGQNLSFVNFNTTTGWSSSVPSGISFSDSYALSLDGSTSGARAEVADAFATNPVNLTLSVWVYPEEDSCNIVWDYGNSAAWRIGLFGNGFSASITASDAAALTAPATLNAWSHVVLTYDRKFFRLYVNGVLVSSDSANAAINYGMSTPTIVFGSTVSPGYCPFKGRIDDARVYNRALSTSEVATLYAGNPYTASGVYTLGSALTVAGNLNIFSGTLDSSSSNYGVTASGSFVNHARFVPHSATVTLSGIGTNLKLFGSTLYNLTVASSKSAILRSNGVISNLLSVASSGILTFNGFDLTATNATITNNGTLTQGTGAILHPSTSYSVTPSSIAIGSSLNLTITDSDENTDGTTQDTLVVAFDDDTATLTETTNTSGIFTGTVTTSNTDKVYGNGILESNDRCLLTPTFTFTDPEDETDTHSSTVTITNTAISCTNGTSAGGGSTGGGGGGRGRSRITRTTSATATTTRAPIRSSPSSPRAKMLQKRVDLLLKKIAATTNPLQKRSLQRTLDRLQKTIDRMR